MYELFFLYFDDIVHLFRRIINVLFVNSSYAKEFCRFENIKFVRILVACGNFLRIGEQLRKYKGDSLNYQNPIN